MGGRRSRYWCGPGTFRETKKAPARGFIGQRSVPAFFPDEERQNESRHGQWRDHFATAPALRRVDAGQLVPEHYSGRDPCALSTLLQFGETRFTGEEGYGSMC
jgi:hypothetical protein